MHATDRIAATAREAIARCLSLAQCSEEPGFTTRSFLSEPMRDVHAQLGGSNEEPDRFSDGPIYNDPLLACNSPGPMAYNAPYAFEILQTTGRVTMLMEYYHEVRRTHCSVSADRNFKRPSSPGPT